MLVVHVINDLNRGGAETLLLSICKGILAKNSSIQFHILILRPHLPLAEEFDEAGIPWEVLPFESTNFFHNVKILTKRLRELQPDIVHSHLLKSDRIAPFSAFLAGISKRFVTIHSMEPYSNRYDFFHRKISGLFATKLISVSESAKNYFIEKRFYPKSKLEVIYNSPGFEGVKIKEPERKNQVPTFINVGRLSVPKAQQNLFRAFKQILESGIDCRLIVLGEGEEREVLTNLLNELRLGNDVELKGNVSNVADYLHDADYFVSSSIWEGMPLSLLEALTVGIPLVATTIPPHIEVLGKSEKPIIQKLAEPGDVESLKNAMFEILNSTNEEYIAMHQQAIEVSKHFTYESMINNYIELYS